MTQSSNNNLSGEGSAIYPLLGLAETFFRGSWVMLLTEKKGYSRRVGWERLLNAIEHLGKLKVTDYLAGSAGRCFLGPGSEEIFEKFRKVCLVPVQGGADRAEGILIVASPDHEPWRDQDLSLLDSLAAQLAAVAAMKREKTALLEALKRQKLVVDSMPALIAYWDREERCRFANQPYFEWFGYTPERLYGISMKQLLGEALYEMNKGYIDGAKRGIPQIFERDLRRAAHGDIRHTQASYIPDVVGGEVLGFFVLVTDVTERKRAEVEAVRAKEEAMRASEVKSRFLANMSHEIRTPVNGVMGMISIALASQLDPMQRECLEAAENSARHLLLMVNDILDLSKIEAGEITIHKKPFALRPTIESALAPALMLARRKGLEAEVVFGEGLPETVVGDSVRLLQVILNIFGNAVKFTAAGSVELKIHAGLGDLVHFEVADTGIGIPADQFDKIFLPFSQVNESLSREFSGTGLGLSISRDLTRLMGGEIEVDSALGGGSVFRFALPLPLGQMPAAIPKDAAKAPAQWGSSGREKLKVLMAEDDPVCRRVQAFFLEQLGCEITHASSGKDAVEFSRRTRFDLIFMDMHMPECDGIEATRRIRADETGASQRTPIIAITANAFRSDLQASLEAGMNAFVTKPVDQEKLAEAMNSLVGRPAGG